LQEIDYIVPTWNSDKTLRITLQSIRKYGYPGRILIVDRGSTDNTLSIANDFGCIIISCDKPLGAARREGAKCATSQMIAFVDSDVEITAEWKDILTFVHEKCLEDIGIVGACYSGRMQKVKSWPIILEVGNGPFGCTVTRRDLVLECEEMDRYSSAEDGIFGRFLAAKKMKWCILPVPVIHHHELTDISEYSRWRWLGAGLRIKDGFKLSYIKSIMGGAIVGVRVKNLELDYFENFKVRWNYLMGYMSPKKYYEIDRNKQSKY
jgi:glycosyltransferase involved in cell wall biosynthesis